MSICLIAPDPRTPYGHLRAAPIRCARCGTPLDDYDAPGGWTHDAWDTPGGWCCEHCRDEADYAEQVNAAPSRSDAPAAMPQAADLAGEPPALPDDGETWIEDLPEDEADTTRTIQALVAEATRGLVDPEAARWLAEETLWQVASLLTRTGRISLPEIGTLEVVDTQAGTALLASASPVLGCNRAREVTP